mmetsp:Transcript_20660/g.24829  ORF Transcript_20660/g.24829 Transcript_20660/m.24829 type:complete len:215 (-) Transcript_20660:268-912(-)|eukprot:CAMPEP_0197864742 /NCGR_PEP_ID=MMETSP1438-20131217/43220_1 /TAXON_ID=1461541 /ORGANISM="Pterosperma sp., Strain CCMP1384" /LENGTH=214 /DNA_ID=CAMNT_0043483105 /DNA_START=46 /DNA_END=690 /DNA_ORIENTATION=+
MGCGPSKASLDAIKVQLPQLDFTHFHGLACDGLAEFAEGGVLKTVKKSNSESEVQTADGGKVLLKVKFGDSAIEYIDPASGAVVLLVCQQQLGNFFSGQPTIWSVWAAKPAQPGQQPEHTHNGSMMFKWATANVLGDGPLEYLDSNGALVCKIALLSYKTAKVIGADGVKVGAVLEDIANPHVAKAITGTITFAKGIDPVIMVALANNQLSIAD